MYLLLVILMVIASLLVCFIMLIQNSKGGDLASGFSSSNQITGVRKATDFLEKVTQGLVVFSVVTSIAPAYAIPSTSRRGSDVTLEQAQQEEEANPYNMPVGTAAPQTETPAPAVSDSVANQYSRSTVTSWQAKLYSEHCVILPVFILVPILNFKEKV